MIRALLVQELCRQVATDISVALKKAVEVRVVRMEGLDCFRVLSCTAARCHWHQTSSIAPSKGYEFLPQAVIDDPVIASLLCKSCRI